MNILRLKEVGNVRKNENTISDETTKYFMVSKIYCKNTFKIENCHVLYKYGSKDIYVTQKRQIALNFQSFF